MIPNNETGPDPDACDLTMYQIARRCCPHGYTWRCPASEARACRKRWEEKQRDAG